MSRYIKINNKILSYSIALAFLMLLTGLQVNAQTRIISPYSKYGVGELNNNQLSRNIGMAGLGYGYRSNKSVNYLNPASYTKVDENSFVFEAVGYSHFYEQKTVAQAQTSNYSSLGNIGFSFPIIGNKLAVGAGLKPYSLVGYKMLDEDVGEYAGTVNYLYEGAGGLNEVYFGTAYSLFDNFSVGVNASYLFGNIEDKVTISSRDMEGFFSTNKISNDNIKGFLYNFGMQYERELAENREFVMGLTYGHETNFDITRSRLIKRELPGQTGVDTLLHNSTTHDNQLSLPKKFGAGAWLKYNENWSGGIDFDWQNWDDFRRFGDSEELQDSYNLAAGIKFSPTAATYTGFFRDITYMGGVRYGQSYLNVNNYSFDELGMSFGIYIPFSNDNNGINLGFEYTQRGTTEQSLIKEDFYRVNIALNIHERWFIQRRFF